MRRFTLVAAVVVLSPVTVAAQAFDLESSAPGFFSSLALSSGGQTLTLTPVSPGNFVYVADPSGVALLGTRAAGGTITNPLAVGQFSPLRFTFLKPVGSVTFNFGDRGGDGDSPARIEAFDAGGTLLGTFDTPYPTGFAAGASRALAFGGGGASYFIVSSGSQGIAGAPDGFNDNSLFWDVAASEVAASTVPEPAALVLVASGALLAGLVARRRPRV